MSYSQDKGQLTRCNIVELCRSKKSLATLASELNVTRDRVSKHCRRLSDEGWLKVTKGTGGWPNYYLTIKEEKYPEPDEIVESRKPEKQKPSPHGKIYTMDYFDKIPGYFDTKLKKPEYRGIHSGFSMMDNY